MGIAVSGLAASERFHGTVLSVLGVEPSHADAELVEWEDWDISPTEHVHLAFPANTDATVRAFHAAALGAGYEDHGPPGEPAAYHSGYYGAFVLDPDGHNVEVVNHNR